MESIACCDNATGKCLELLGVDPLFHLCERQFRRLLRVLTIVVAERGHVGRASRRIAAKSLERGSIIELLSLDTRRVGLLLVRQPIHLMTRDAQKREELHLVEQMRQRLGGQPEGTLEASDEPDVCVVGSERRVGVEVTELHQRPRPGEPPRRLLESERSRIVALAGALAQSAGIPPLHVAVHFNDRVGVEKHDRDLIAKTLLAVIAENIPGIDQSITIEMWRRPSDSLPEVRLVRIYRVAALTKHHWAVPDSGWVQTDFVTELQQAIDSKNRRYATYRRRCDECWLLITASGGRPSGLFEPSLETKSQVYRSSFAKTFFMEVFSQELVELNTTAA
jgi:hypothetical protein